MLGQKSPLSSSSSLINVFVKDQQRLISAVSRDREVSAAKDGMALVTGRRGGGGYDIKGQLSRSPSTLSYHTANEINRINTFNNLISSSSFRIYNKTSLSSPPWLNQQKRTVIHHVYGPLIPRPPPRQYEPDGSLKRYRTNAQFWDHGIRWVRWEMHTVGVFHTCYLGTFAEELPPRNAFRQQFRGWSIFIPIYCVSWIWIAFVLNTFSFGITPEIFTQDWVEASRERDRAENSYPFTRYLDRRRKERGPHWLPGKYMPKNVNFMFQSNHRDTAYLRGKAIKARKQWLEEEDRKRDLEEMDKELLGMTDEDEEDEEEEMGGGEGKGASDGLGGEVLDVKDKRDGEEGEEEE